MSMNTQPQQRQTPGERETALETTVPQEDAKKAGKISGFGKFLLVFALVLVLAVAGIWAYLWQVLVRFESTTPRAALDYYFAQLEAGDTEWLRAGADFTPDDLNSWDDYLRWVEEHFGGHSAAQLRYQQLAQAEGAGSQRYTVYSGEQALGEVMLHPDTDAEHGWAVSAEVTYLPGYTVTAPGDVAVLVNGHPLAQSGADTTTTPVAHFEALADRQMAPTVVEYKMAPTLYEPDFAADGPDGMQCEWTVDTENRSAQVQLVLDDAQQEACAQALEAAAKSYATYVTGDSSFADLRQHLYPDTALFANMAGFDSSWYIDHEAYVFEDVQVSGIRPAGAHAFSGDISFNYIVRQAGYMPGENVSYTEGYSDHTFPSSYHMSFVQSGGVWLLLDLQVQ